MNNIPTTPPSGFRDFTPQDCVMRAKAIETISRVYRSFGFQPIATSAVEDLAVLLGKGGGENEKLIFKIQKRGDKLTEAARMLCNPLKQFTPEDFQALAADLSDLGLRFDLTLPLARYYSKYGSQLPHPFKAFNIGPVWRAERAQKGRYREFYQCDADIIGSESVQSEVDVISAVLTAFDQLGIPNVSVHLNDRRILTAIFDAEKIPVDKRGPLCIELDKLDKVDRNIVWGDIRKLLGNGVGNGLEPLVFGVTPTIEWLRHYAEEPIDHLKAILDLLVKSIGEDRLAIRPNLVRGFDYYTSTVFEFRHPKFSGSVGGGGRYDRLTEKFGGQPVPACGASIGFERMLLILEESKAVPQKEGKRVCVTIFDESLRQKTLDIVARIRARNISGLCIDVYPGNGKLKAQFKYADTTGADFALVMGPDEAAAGKIKRKDLKSGEEAAMSFEELARSLS